MSAKKDAAKAKKELAQKIVRAVEAQERVLVSPGNLQWVKLTPEEQATLEYETDLMPLSEIRKLA